jgi:hypothetical protein
LAKPPINDIAKEAYTDFSLKPSTSQIAFILNSSVSTVTLDWHAVHQIPKRLNFIYG